MIKTKDEIIKAFSDIVGEDNSDAVIAFLEDISDTLSDASSKISEVENIWREKYRARFLESVEEPEKSGEIEQLKEDITIKDIFKEN